MSTFHTEALESAACAAIRAWAQQCPSNASVRQVFATMSSSIASAQAPTPRLAEAIVDGLDDLSGWLEGEEEPIDEPMERPCAGERGELDARAVFEGSVWRMP